MTDNKNIYLIVGKSGSGKTTLVEGLCNKYPELSAIQSYTTRPRRSANETGHTFITPLEWKKQIKQEDMVAYTHFNGYDYCATVQQVEENDIFVVDPAGIDYFCQHYKGNKKPIIYYIDCGAIDRFKRLYKRDGLKKAISRFLHDIIPFYGMNKKADFILRTDNKTLSLAQAIFDTTIISEKPSFYWWE